ncbi:hypothetical protein KR009_002652, partial [Drosophila setifemur]
APKRLNVSSSCSTTTQKKSQPLSSSTASSGVCSSNNKPKYSLTLHNSKHKMYSAGGKSMQVATLQQRQHLKALRLSREMAEAGGLESSHYKRPVGPTRLSAAKEMMGVHLKAGEKLLALNGGVLTNPVGASSNLNVSSEGPRNEKDPYGKMESSVIRTQNNRLW